MASTDISKFPKENDVDDTDQDESGRPLITATTEAHARVGNKLLDFLFFSPVRWFQMLTEKIHWSFVVSVIAIYGMNQGVGWAIFQVSSDYYWKDVHKIQPSEAQVYSGIISIPWIVKPIWGLFTDILPVAGYRRKPYFVLAGCSILLCS